MRQNDDFKHNRFMSLRDGYLIFGCINPFCGHGSPALPNHWEIPVETDAIKICLVSHNKNERKLVFDVRLNKDVGIHKTGEIVRLTCADNLPACQTIFGNFFLGKEDLEEGSE